MHSSAFGKSRGSGRRFQNDPRERVEIRFAVGPDADVREEFLEIAKRIGK